MNECKIKLLMKYPYYINPDIDALAEATGEERLKLMQHIAACVGDETALRTILGIDPDEFRCFYPDMTPPELTTDQTINSFIDRFASDQKVEVKELEDIIAAPAIDYSTMMANEEDNIQKESTETDDATSAAISAFLKDVRPSAPRKNKELHPKSERKSHETADPDLNEALFRLMVKNKNYTKALEIINELSLNNPKKSVYFAHQKRFLQKLIKNQ